MIGKAREAAQSNNTPTALGSPTCPRCGYDVRAQLWRAEQRASRALMCPECGNTSALEHLKVPSPYLLSERASAAWLAPLLLSICYGG
jgi:ribosomal protein S27AE